MERRTARQEGVVDERYERLQEALDLGLFGLVYGLREGDTPEQALLCLVDELVPLLDRPPYALMAVKAGFSLDDALKIDRLVEAAHECRPVETPANVVDFVTRLQASAKACEATGTSDGYECTSTQRDARILALLRKGMTGEDIYRVVGGKRAVTMRRIKELRRVA